MEIEGKNGSTSHTIQTNKDGILLNNSYAAKLQELVLSGNVYSTGMTTTSISSATFTTGTLDAACTPIVGVWNPPNSGKNLVILKANVEYIMTNATSTGAGCFVWATSISQSSISTGLAPFNRLTFNASGSVAKGFANTALTGLSGSLVVRESAGIGSSNGNYSQVGTAVGFALSPVNALTCDIDGAIIVPQGGVLALLGTTTPVAISAASSLLWAEINA